MNEEVCHGSSFLASRWRAFRTLVLAMGMWHWQLGRSVQNGKCHWGLDPLRADVQDGKRL